MKYYISSYNGVLDPLKEKLTGHLTLPQDADVWIVWQDVQGSFRDLIQTQKKLGINKPVYCVQHGRAATLDYDKPNSFAFNADRFLAWGKSDFERMRSLGYKDRVTIVGCPLNAQIKPKTPHKEKVVLFVPVNTGKEEPENIAVYYELLKIRYHNAQVKVLDNRLALKDKWGFDGKLGVSFNEINTNFEVVAKLLPWHEKALYHGNVFSGYQQSPKNNALVFELLRNVDAVVGLDEGCTEVFAYAHDVPVVIAKGFQYRQHEGDGRNFSLMDTYETKASTRVSLTELKDAIEYSLAHPEYKKQERAEVAEEEMGLSYGNATDNILNFIRKDMKAKHQVAHGISY